MGEESRDWGNLLPMMNAVENAHIYGRMSFIIGCVILLLGLVWAGYILYLQKKNMTPF